jgi:hypothetical protein
VVTCTTRFKTKTVYFVHTVNLCAGMILAVNTDYMRVPRSVFGLFSGRSVFCEVGTELYVD